MFDQVNDITFSKAAGEKDSLECLVQSLTYFELAPEPIPPTKNDLAAVDVMYAYFERA
jgi:hypothetical protein